MRMSTLLLLAAGYFLFFTDAGSKFLKDAMIDFNAGSDIASYTCDTLARRFEGESVQNLLGGSFQIIEVSGLTQVRKDSREIVCRGKVTLSNGRQQSMQLSVASRDGRIFYEAKGL